MSNSKIYVGIDIGGTKIGLNAINEDRKPIHPNWIEVPAMSDKGPKQTVGQIVVGVKQLLEQRGVKADAVVGCGLDSPGPASKNGRIEKSANMHPDWEGFELRENAEKALTEHFGRSMKVSYENDCNSAALWESQLGDPTGKEVMALLAPGTGLGGGIVIHGRLLRGSRGMGAELGHVEIVHPPFVPGAEPQCGCGQKYCAEAYASLAAMAKFLPNVLALPKWKNHPLQQLSGEDVWKKRAYQMRGLAAKGDELALSIFDWQSQAIGKLCRQVADTIDPDRIVIGGGFIEGGKELTDRIMRVIRETFKSLSFKAHASSVVIETAGAADQAGCLGAAMSAWQAAHWQE